jgi:hypothetical protein
VALGTVIADERDSYAFRVITENGNQVWEYFHLPVVFAWTAYHLTPYQSREFLTTWNMMNDNGTPWPRDDDFPITPGSYNVIGELNLLAGERVPVSVPIRVIPEPSSLLFLAIGLVALLGRKNK